MSVGGVRRLWVALAVVATLPGLVACSGASYYWQSMTGHLALMHAARPLDDWLQAPETDAALKRRLELAQRIRAFAVSELKLPDNASYRRYADLGRSAVVWNVVAAPELSLKPREWCFPVAGCVPYRGFFSEAQANAEAQALQREGLEVSVYGVPAYSTLGWMNWAGGDPLLSTFIAQPEAELARLIFHELAHQRVYVADDSSFNEAFATAVERQGGRLWLLRHGAAAELQRDAATQDRRQALRALAKTTRERLKQIYADHAAGRTNAQAARQAKAITMAEMRRQYQQLRDAWVARGDLNAAVLAGYDRWAERANNASLASLATYEEQVPAFEALFIRSGSDWGRFYDAVRALAALPKAQRQQALGMPTKETTGG